MSKKGISSIVILIGILVVLFAVAGTVPKAVVGTQPTCQSGYQSNLIYDATKCGTTLERSNYGWAGICVPFTCPRTIGTDIVAYCDIRDVVGQNTIPTNNLVRLQPGESRFFSQQCSYNDPNLFIYYSIYRNSVNGCYTACTPIAGIKPDECTSGSVRCGSGTEIQVCTVPDSIRNYAHWTQYGNCQTGVCQTNGNGIDCLAPCQSDSQCTTNSYCSSNLCRQKAVDGLSCTADNQCLSSFCDRGLLGVSSGVCKTKSGSPATCGDFSQIKDSESCLQCGGKWNDPGFFGRGFTILFGGRTSPPVCEQVNVFTGIADFTGSLQGSIIIILMLVLGIIVAIRVLK